MKKSKVFLISAGAVVLLMASILFVPAVKVVSVSGRKNPDQKVYSREAAAKGFCISYTHSVNKGRVHDYYDINRKDNSLVLETTHFVSYGAGIPEPEETPGAQFRKMYNGYVIENIDRKVQKLVMAVGIIANHSFMPRHDGLQFGEITDEEFLTDYFAPQTSIILEVKRVSPLEYIFHRFKNDVFLF